MVKKTLLAWLDKERGNWPKIAKAAGVNYWWLQRFAQNRINNPGFKTITRLFDYYETITSDGVDIDFADYRPEKKLKISDHKRQLHNMTRAVERLKEVTTRRSVATNNANDVPAQLRKQAS